MKHRLWILMNFWSWLTGFPALASLNQTVAMFGLHGLGYDNRYSEHWTGEYWFIKNILPAIGGAACMDIGAHIGNYSVELTKYVQGEVYAFEPLSSSFAKLQERTSDRIHPFRLAITDYDGEASIMSRGEKAVDATLQKVTAKGDAIEERISVLTLDSFVAQQGISDIGFIKIDTEGNEMEVLKSMQGLLQEHPPQFIQFEFNFHHVKRGHTLLSLTQLLPGYEFYRLLSHGMLKIDPEKYIDNVFMYSNIIARRIS